MAEDETGLLNTLIKSANDPTTAEGQLAAWVMSAEMDRVLAYVVRGRCYAELPGQDLLDHWTAAAKAFCLDAGSAEKRQAEADLKAELGLRGIEAPMQNIQPEVSILSERFRENGERLRRENPAEFARIEDELASLIGGFETAKAASGN